MCSQQLNVQMRGSLRSYSNDIKYNLTEKKKRPFSAEMGTESHFSPKLMKNIHIFFSLPCIILERKKPHNKTLSGRNSFPSIAAC